MKLYCDGQYKHNPEYMLRRCGYGKMVGRNTGQTSYMRLINGRTLYPRFHAYLEDFEGGFQINLHLDQRQPSYSGTSAHGGEYEGEVVEKEGERIMAMVQSFKL